jgi:hypothetical protein
MQQVRLPEGQAVGQYAPNIEEEAGPCHAPQRGGTVEEYRQPEGFGGMEDEVLTYLGRGDHYHQQRKEQGVSVDLPVEEKQDTRQGDARQ